MIAGVSTFAFFRVGEVGLGSEEAFAPIVSMWFLVFTLGPGFFLPLEQELSRSIAHRLANGEGSRPIVRRVALTGIVITALVLAAMALASPVLTRVFFRGNWWVMGALAVAFVAYAIAFIVRGVCAGSRRFTGYATVLSTDGVIRIVGCLALAQAGVTHVGAYAMLVACSPLPALVWVIARGDTSTDPGPPVTALSLTKNLGWLLVANVAAASLLNAGPILAETLAGKTQPELVTRFGRGVLIARIPLFMFQAVQASLLPQLARDAANGKFSSLRQGVNRLLALIGALALIGTVGAYLLAPWVIELFYGSELSSFTMAMLTLSAVLYMASITLAQGLLALDAHRLVALGWTVGVIALGAGTWLSTDQITLRIEIGLLCASIASAAVFGAMFHRRLAAAIAAGTAERTSR